MRTFAATTLAISVIALPASVRADPATLGPAATMAEASGGYVGKLSLAPNHAPVGEVVHARGSGFRANEKLDLVWRTVEGSWKVGNGEYHGREYKPAAFRVAEVATDAAGAFDVSFATPEDFGFAHDVVVQQGGRLLTQANFNLDMTWEISPKNAPAGTPLTIDIKGIGWRELESSWDLVYDNMFTGWISTVTTHGSAHFTIPATGATGRHTVKLIHGEFTFPYLNPQQNPVPDRPRFETAFDLVAGPPVSPPPVEAQTQRKMKNPPPPGAVVIEPAFAPVGAPLVAQAKGLTPGKAYKLAFGTMTGNRVGGGGFDEATRDIAESTADSHGDIAFKFDAPDDLGGAHRISIDDAGKTIEGVFTIVSNALPVAATSGSAGAPFSFHLKGVGWTETANIYTIVIDNNYVGYACAFNSQGDVEVFLNMEGAPGWHFIDAYPAIYKGQETRPNNFRIPQLTYAEDHPGEDLPAFHFAYEVKEEHASAAGR